MVMDGVSDDTDVEYGEISEPDEDPYIYYTAPQWSITKTGMSDTELNNADVHVGGVSLDNGPDVLIASPESLYLDYDSDIIPATPEPCPRVIVLTSRIPQQAHVPSERIPSQLNFLVYNSEQYDVAHHCCSFGC
ncbi:hypothetical protein J6590_065355 [Homalodisca vitripennis]|nr:hypothetical protein J6590_065355 [Homalodisca vitripennis]